MVISMVTFCTGESVLYGQMDLPRRIRNTAKSESGVEGNLVHDLCCQSLMVHGAPYYLPRLDVSLSC